MIVTSHPYAELPDRVPFQLVAGEPRNLVTRHAISGIVGVNAGELLWVQSWLVPETEFPLNVPVTIYTCELVLCRIEGGGAGGEVIVGSRRSGVRQGERTVAGRQSGAPPRATTPNTDAPPADSGTGWGGSGI